MDQNTQKQDEAPKLQAAKRLALAYQAVLGQPNRRSSDQKLVIDDLRERSAVDTFMFEGDFNPYRAAQRDGARVQFLVIERMLSKALAHANEQPKIESIK